MAARIAFSEMLILDLLKKEPEALVIGENFRFDPVLNGSYFPITVDITFTQSPAGRFRGPVFRKKSVIFYDGCLSFVAWSVFNLFFETPLPAGIISLFCLYFDLDDIISVTVNGEDTTMLALPSIHDGLRKLAEVISDIEKRHETNTFVGENIIKLVESDILTEISEKTCDMLS